MEYCFFSSKVIELNTDLLILPSEAKLQYMELAEKKMRETIEETGKVFEKFGLTPMQGRIVAYFTLSDPP